MTPERWQQVREVLHGALQLAPKQRPAFLHNACAADDSLRREVESLLASSDEALSSFLKSTAMRVALTKGTRLGDYEVQSLLGSGGMGEVYRARDLRLHRDVAIKVLPAFLSSDPDRLRRFEQEARAAAALNHPNILGVHQLGTYEGAPYLVSELLEGLTLREHVRRGPLPIRKAIDYAIQIAHGLATAHDKGIVHRDLKPENLFVTKDGRLKILDFGLAKLIQPKTQPDAETRTLDQQTEPGMVMGTVGYMSPEQVRGEPTDNRADIFAFGAILYEMLSGKRAFQGATAPDTMGAILKDDPLPIDVSPPLNRLVSHCLEKSAESRFQSAKDIAFDLGTLLDLVSSISSQVAPLPAAKKMWLWITASMSVLAVALVASMAYWVAVLHPDHWKPVFHQLTFQQGAIDSALYAPGGDTVIFVASWGGGRSELYSLRVDSPTGVKAMGILAYRVLAISRRGEIVFLQGLEGSPFGGVGTLAEVPLGAGGPRAILDNVLSADWSPTKDDLAISRRFGGRFRLEYPIGRVLRESSGYIDSVHFSADGRQLAFVEHPSVGDSSGFIAIADLSGPARVLSRRRNGILSLVWAPSGDEIWFTAGDFATNTSLFAVSLKGRERILASVPGTIAIQSVLANGRALAIHHTARHVLMVSTPEYPAERDLSWLDWPDSPVFSPDGKYIEFTESSAATQMRVLVAIEPVDGRKGIDSLARLCQEKLAEDPFSGCVFVFRSRSGTAIRLLSYDGQGYWLAQKRLSRGRFVWWPEGSGAAKSLESYEVQLLMAAGDVSRVHAAPMWRRVSVLK